MIYSANSFLEPTESRDGDCIAAEERLEEMLDEDLTLRTTILSTFEVPEGTGEAETPSQHFSSEFQVFDSVRSDDYLSYTSQLKEVALLEGWEVLFEAKKKDSQGIIDRFCLRCKQYDKNSARRRAQKENPKRRVGPGKSNCQARMNCLIVPVFDSQLKRYVRLFEIGITSILSCSTMNQRKALFRA